MIVTENVVKIVLERLENMGFKVEQIHKEVEEAVEECKSFCNHRSKYEIYEKFVIEEDRVVIENLKVLKGETVSKSLKGSEYILAGVITLGKDIEEKGKEFFERGEYTKGLIWDIVSNVFLEKFTLDFWEDMKKKVETYGKKITPPLFPGSGWDIENQAAVVELAGAKEIGVGLNESFNMVPAKSVSFICGIGDSVQSCEITSTCDTCPFVNCIYRKNIMSNKLGEKEYKITVYHEGKERVIMAREGENLFFVLSKNGIYLPNSCGGNRVCGKCRVKLDKVGQVSKEEAYFLSKHDIENGVRLACFVEIYDDLRVEVLYKERGARILTYRGLEDTDVFNLDSRISIKDVIATLPNLEDQKDFLCRLKKLGEKDFKVPLKLLKKLPSYFEEEKNLKLVIRGNELIDIKDAGMKGEYGIAIDIGTTTIVAY
ncbi:MAG: 2Fe-2S iron-sulfur cluster-binding protein, partial [Caldanaerobacter sp.]